MLWLIGRSLAAIAFAGALQGCASVSDLQKRLNDRWGPDPAIPTDDVSVVLSRQHQTMWQIAVSAGAVTGEVTTPGPLPLQPDQWPSVAGFGMNYVDEKCDTYMHDLFILNREHDRIDTILKKVDTVSTAIVGVAVSAANAKVPLLAIGQSFGLVESVNDAAAKSYLFEQVPSIVADKVRQARTIYRSIVENSAKGKVDSEFAAYRTIRGYLSLCMPQTIEGTFLQTYIAANPKVTSIGDLGQISKTKSLAPTNSAGVKDLNFIIGQ